MKHHFAAQIALIAILQIAPAGRAFPGGLLGDAVKLVNPTAADEANVSNRDLSAAVKNFKASEQGRTNLINQNLIGESSTCLTPIGSCAIGSTSLKGTACFCQFGAQQIFGAAQ